MGCDKLPSFLMCSSNSLRPAPFICLNLLTTMVGPPNSTALYDEPKLPLPSTSAEALRRSCRSNLSLSFLKKDSFPLSPPLLWPPPLPPPPVLRLPRYCSFDWSTSSAVVDFLLIWADRVLGALPCRWQMSRKQKATVTNATAPTTIATMAGVESFFEDLDSFSWPISASSYDLLHGCRGLPQRFALPVSLSSTLTADQFLLSLITTN